MPDRENERFDLDEEFLAEQEDSSDFDRMLEVVGRYASAY